MKNLIYMAENHPQSEPWCVKGTEFHTQIQVEQYVFENLWSTSVPVTADNSFIQHKDQGRNVKTKFSVFLGIDVHL